MLRILFTCIVFLLGAGATVNQIIFLREFYVSSGGNELFFAVIFGIWLLGVAVGGYASGKMFSESKDLSGNRFKGIDVTFFLLVIQSLAAVFIVFMIRGIRVLMSVPGAEPFPFFKFCIACFILIFPFSFLVGYLFTQLCRWRELFSKIKNVGKNSIGFIYTVESFGSALSGMLASIFLAGKISSILISSSIFLLVAFSVYLLRAKLMSEYKNEYNPPGKICATFALLFYLALACFTILLLPSGNRIEQYSYMYQWKSFGEGLSLIDYKDTPYQHYSVCKQADQYSLYSNGELLTSFPDPYNSSERANLFMTLHPTPQRILIVGSGDEESIKWMLEYKPQLITVVDIDPMQLPFVKKYYPLDTCEIFNNPAVKFIHNDPRVYIKLYSQIKDAEKFDMIIINAPEPSTIAANRFYTVEFYQLVNSILKKDGIMLTSVVSAVNYFGEPVLLYAGSVYKSVKSVFPFVSVMPGTKALLIASQSQNSISLDPKLLQTRFAAKITDGKYFSQYNFISILDPEEVKFTNDSFQKTEKSIPVNTDLFPVSNLLNLILWADISGSQTTLYLHLFRQLSTKHILIFIVFISLICLMIQTIMKKRIPHNGVRSGGAYLIAATGFFLMAGEIVMLYSYQRNFGTLYQKIGMLVSCMMFGLAAGGIISTKLKSENPGWVYYQIIVFDVMILLALGLSSLSLKYEQVIEDLMGTEALEYLSYFILVIYGVLGGVQFPLLGKLLRIISISVRQTTTADAVSTGAAAGFVEFSDHAGAVAGAVITGLILIPLTGIYLTLNIILFIKILSLLIFVHGVRKAI